MDFDDPGFRELIDALHDGVYITDADGITLKVNSAYERLTGLRAEDVVGQHMQALVEQGVISQSVSLRVLKEGKALSLMGLSSGSRRAHGCGGGAEGGEVVLRCAVKVMAAQVGRDNAIAGGSGSRWLGAAREWLPLRSAQSRADIAGWTRQQSYCR